MISIIISVTDMKSCERESAQRGSFVAPHKIPVSVKKHSSGEEDPLNN